MKISFTGSQLGMTNNQRTYIRYELETRRPSAVIHGACIGADDEFDEIAYELGIPRIIFPSNHPTKSALDKCIERCGERERGKLIVASEPMPPLKRNPLIVRAGDQLIACPSQPNEVIRSGTWTTVRLGRKILGRKNVEIILP